MFGAYLGVGRGHGGLFVRRRLLSLFNWIVEFRDSHSSLLGLKLLRSEAVAVETPKQCPRLVTHKTQHREWEKASGVNSNQSILEGKVLRKVIYNIKE